MLIKNIIWTALHRDVWEIRVTIRLLAVCLLFVMCIKSGGKHLIWVVPRSQISLLCIFDMSVLKPAVSWIFPERVLA